MEGSLSLSSKPKNQVFSKENRKILTQFILTFLFVGIGIWFLKHERTELSAVKNSLLNARWYWVMAGLGLTAVYITLQGLMYVASFAAVRARITPGMGIVLFLKRNFISVFLPAGGISSLAFFTDNIKKKGISETKIHFASAIYGFTGILSVLIVGVPAFIYAIVEKSIGNSEYFGIAALIFLTAFLILIYRSVFTKGILYKWIIRLIPAAEITINELLDKSIDRKRFLLTVFFSVLIEITGIIHVYIAISALGFTPSVFAAILAYIISVIFLVISPFLRGLGAIEVSMSIVLVKLGFANEQALAITLLYRFFEFWIPFFSGIVAFLARINKFLLRIVPGILIMILGITNIISVLTPAIGSRLNLLLNYLPTDAINASNYFVLFAGMLMVATSAFMMKGLRSSWWVALVLSLLSSVGHLTKAIDYEEAILNLIVVVILIATRKEYHIKSNPKIRNIGIQTIFISILAVMIYGTIGFYFMDKKHLNIDFNLSESIKYTFKYFFLFGSDNLVPGDSFTQHFLISLKISGLITLSFLVYILSRPFIFRHTVENDDQLRAKDILNKYGQSALDYFKTYPDKLLFIVGDQAFVSFRVSGNFAVVLENPVAKDSNELKQCIRQFDKYCIDNSLKCLYYRVPEEYLDVYHETGKKSLFLGQEGIIDLNTFTLEGNQRKSIRNAINKVKSAGYKVLFYEPPIKDGLLQKIKLVSDEWLEHTHRSEIIFSQGMFLWDELKTQTIITIENPEEKVVAFLNIIPDYAQSEATYDLIRFTHDAPGGVVDFIMVEMFNYLKSKGYTSVNLGFAPMSGNDDPHNFPEQSMRFMYNKFKSFSHYKGLRAYKEKFLPEWHNKYLIYSHDYDLFQVPLILKNIMKP